MRNGGERRLVVVLVEPEYEINIGMTARAVKNFGCKKLRLAKSRAKIGFTAKMFAKHSEEILEKAEKFNGLKGAVRDCDFVLGTTGNNEKYRGRLKKTMALEKAVELLPRSGRIAVVFGSEGNGLNDDELAECDAIARIQTSAEQPIMNVSHAVAVALHEISRRESGGKGGKCGGTRRGESGDFFEPASRKKTLLAGKKFTEIILKLKGVNNPKKVSRAFANILKRSRATDDEVQNLFAALSAMKKAVK